MFKQIIKKLIRWAESDDSIERMKHLYVDQKYRTNSPKPTNTSPAQEFEDNNRGKSFIVYKANGGCVVSVTAIHSKTEREETQLYIIPDGADLGDEIAQIITVDGFSR